MYWAINRVFNIMVTGTPLLLELSRFYMQFPTYYMDHISVATEHDQDTFMVISHISHPIAGFLS